MILGSFPSETALMEAARALHAEGIGPVETHTPSPPEAKETWLRLAMLIAGILGAAGGFGLQAYATGIDYRIDIGGRPDVFWPSYMFFTLETGLMSAMVVGFVGFLIANRMPTLYKPIDESDAFRRASRDAWFLAVSTDDPDHARRAMETLRRHKPLHLEELAS